MARIILNSALQIGADSLSLVNQTYAAVQQCQRLTNTLNAITNNGAEPANLETDPRAMIPTGQGPAYYSGIIAINTALQSITANLAAIDQS